MHKTNQCDRGARPRPGSFGPRAAGKAYGDARPSGFAQRIYVICF